MHQSFPRLKYVPLMVAALFAIPAHAADTILPEIRVQSAVRPDLDPDSPANPYRVTPSSRPLVQTFTAADIAALHPRDIFDVLTQAAGVLPTTQGRRLPFSLQIRGDTNFAFIIDGAYLPPLIAGRILQNLPPQAIESMEIVRDSSALTLGPLVDLASASGAPNDGFVIIRTRRPQKTEGEVRLAGESHDGAAASAWLGANNGAAYIGLLGAHVEAPGDPEQYHGRRSESGLLRAGLKAGGLSADLSLYQDHSRDQLQRASASESLASLASQKWSYDPANTTLYSLSLGMAWTPSNQTLFNAYRSHVDTTEIDASWLNATQTRTFMSDQTAGYTLKHTYTSGNTLLQAGVSQVHWDSPTGEQYFIGIERDERISSAFLHGEQTLPAQHLTLDASLREDSKQIIRGIDTYGMVSGANTAKLAVIRDQDLPVARFAGLGASWKPLQDWSFVSRYAYADQGGLSGIATVSNTPLDPEKQHKIEAGASYLGWTELVPTLTVFQSKIDNAKAPVKFVTVGNGQVAVYDQIDARLAGFELAFTGNHAWAGGVTRFQGAWSHLSSAAPVSLDNFRTPARNLFNLRLVHDWAQWQATAALQRVGAFQSNFNALDGQMHEIGNYTRLDLSLGRKFLLGEKVARIALFGRNVTGSKYETQLGFPDVGAVWGGELSMAF